MDSVLCLLIRSGPEPGQYKCKVTWYVSLLFARRSSKVIHSRHFSATRRGAQAGQLEGASGDRDTCHDATSSQRLLPLILIKSKSHLHH